MIATMSPEPTSHSPLDPVTVLGEAFLFPANCPICGMSMRRGVDVCCNACDRRLIHLPSPICTRCHRFVPRVGSTCHCDENDVAPKTVYALGLFDHAWRALVHGLKYNGFKALARPLAERLGRGLETLPPIDLIVAVPTDPRKRRERGFGHAELLAEHLAIGSRHFFVPDALTFTRRVADQTRLSGSQRVDNLKGAFKVPDGLTVQGKTVLIVDDVMTTGATLGEAGRALLEAGASKVYGTVIALNLGHVPDGPSGSDYRRR